MTCYRLNSYVEAQPPNATIFGDRALKDVIKVIGGQKGGALIQYDLCPYKKRKRH